MRTKMDLIYMIAFAIAMFSGMTLCATDKPTDKIPLIGILLMHASNGIKAQLPNPFNHYTFASKSYVDWIAQTGAIPVLIPFDVPINRLNRILNEVNGIMLPGGAPELQDENGDALWYQSVTEHIIQYAVNKFDNEGISFPIFGTCLGYENIMMYFNGGKILSNGQDDHLDHNVEIEQTELRESKFFSKIDNDLMNEALGQYGSYYSHDWGVTIETLTGTKYKKAHDQFLWLGYSEVVHENKTIKFLAMTEHRKYPIYGVQFHLEKVAFERAPKMAFMDRSTASIQVSYEIASTFAELMMPTARPYSEFPNWLKPHFPNFWHIFAPWTSISEHIYLMPRFYGIWNVDSNGQPIAKLSQPPQADK